MSGSGPRSAYIDALRGWAMLMVVVGHAIQRADAFGLVPHVAFDPYLPFQGHVTMPLFFLISGYLTFGRVRTPRLRWLGRKAAMLLVPAASWTLVYWFLVDDGLIPTHLPLGAYVLSEALNPSLWFFVVLFGCYALLALGLTLGERWLVPLGLAAAAAVMVLPAGLVYPPMRPLALYWWWWFLGGYLLARFREPLLRWRTVAWAVGVSGYAAALALPISADGPWRAVFALGAASTASLAIHLLGSRPPVGWLAHLGVHSLAVYGAQFLFVQLVVAPSWANVAVTTALAIAGSLALELLLQRFRLTDALFLGARRLPSASRG